MVHINQGADTLDRSYSAYCDYVNRQVQALKDYAEGHDYEPLELAGQALNDDKLRSQLRYLGLRGREAEWIRPQDTWNVLHCVVTGAIQL